MSHIFLPLTCILNLSKTNCHHVPFNHKHIFNPIQDGLSANLFGTGRGGFRPPPKFSACGARRAPKLIHPKSCDVYEANKKKIGPIAQKLGP